jgi:cyclase
VYNSRNVDELVLLDIDASKSRRSLDRFTIQAVASECFMPLAVGGGLRSLDDVASALAHGADKVVLNSIALEDPDFVSRAAGRFGAQCIVGSVDACRRPDGGYAVSSHAGIAVDRDPATWAMELEHLGAGEVLLNSVDQDGTLGGCDAELVSSVSAAVSIPVVAVGGIGTVEHAVTAIRSGAAAVGAASVFHFSDMTPALLRAGIGAAGIPVRT